MAGRYPQECSRKGLAVDWMQLQPQEWYEYEDDINREYKQRRACGERVAMKMTMYEFQCWKRGVLRSCMPEWYHINNIISMPPPQLPTPPFLLLPAPNPSARRRRRCPPSPKKYVPSSPYKRVTKSPEKQSMDRYPGYMDGIKPEPMTPATEEKKMTLSDCGTDSEEDNPFEGANLLRQHLKCLHKRLYIDNPSDSD